MAFAGSIEEMAGRAGLMSWGADSITSESVARCDSEGSLDASLPRALLVLSGG